MASGEHTGSPLRVAVVGAGLAGLAAADGLARSGAEVAVLEARGRVGGRVHSQELPNGAVIERGAEFILPGCTVVMELADRFGLGLWDKGMRYGRREPRGIEVPPGALEAAVAEIGAALERGVAPGESVAGLLGRLDAHPGAREAIAARAEISAASPAGEVPAAELGLLARISDDPAPSIAGGNQAIAAALAAALPARSVHPRTVVHEILAGEDGVRVRTDGGDVAADSCIVAVPLPLLGAIRIDPPLPVAVTEALGGIGFGHAAKLFVPLAGDPPSPSATLAVPDRFWAWTHTGAGDRSQPVVSCFAGSAPALGGLEVGGGPGRWLRRLAALRPDLRLSGDEAVLVSWDEERFTRGAYSVGAPPDGPELEALRGPHGRVALAGEHLGGEMAALMEGALRSGFGAAAAIRRALPPGR